MQKRESDRKLRLTLSSLALCGTKRALDFSALQKQKRRTVVPRYSRELRSKNNRDRRNPRSSQLYFFTIIIEVLKL